jgi:hypothetical protein
MSASLTILALVFYPVVFNLPFNFVRFKWSYTRGLAAMPLEVQESAEAADRAVDLVFYVVLLGFVAFLQHGSLISAYAVGLTTDNWKSAVALGALLSFVPLSFGAILQRIVPPNEVAEQPESRGPLITWGGLTVLSSLSIEFWRVFCIAALLRFDVSAWVVVLVVAVAFGATQLITSIARAAGAAFFGALAGYLFVQTGSLLAPLTMSLIVGGVQLYRVRHRSSRLSGSRIALPGRRYVKCPTCSANFNRRKVERTRRTFTCPECGEVLECEMVRFGYVLYWVCLYGVPVLLYYLGYRDLTLILLSIGGAFLMFLFGYAILSFFFPPKAQLFLKLGESGLHLTDRPKRRENDQPKDDL